MQNFYIKNKVVWKLKLITVEFTVLKYVNTEDRFYDASLLDNMQYIERESSWRRSTDYGHPMKTQI